MSNKHVISDLYQMQSLPLNAKISMTQRRIREWVDEYGEDGVYISFSGGKDSTVLLDIARKLYPNIKAMFIDTGLEYPEIREFVKTFENVDWIKPKLTFRKVIEKYGYPFIGKEISNCIYGARKGSKTRLKRLQGGQRPLQGYNETFYPYQRESSEYQLHPGRRRLSANYSQQTSCG